MCIKLIKPIDRGKLQLSQPPSTSRRHVNKVSAKPDLQQSCHFPNTFLQLPPSQNPVIDFSTPERFKRLVSRCYSSTTSAKNSCTNLTAKVFLKSKSNKLPYLPEPSSELECHCHTKELP